MCLQGHCSSCVWLLRVGLLLIKGRFAYSHSDLQGYFDAVNVDGDSHVKYTAYKWQCDDAGSRATSH